MSSISNSPDSLDINSINLSSPSEGSSPSIDELFNLCERVYCSVSGGCIDSTLADFNPRVVLTGYNALRQERSRTQMVDALTDSGVKTSPESISLDMQALDLRASISPKQVPQKVKEFIVVEHLPNAVEASNYLKVTASKTPAVARAILGDMQPISGPSCCLGHGAFGKVTKVNVLGIPAAAKQVSTFSEDAKTKLLKEARTLVACEHPNIINLGVLDHEQGILYLEFAARGSLSSYLSEPHTTSEDVRKSLHAVASGLSHMHSRGYLHRDIKLDNILVTEDGTAKISDLGSAISFDDFNTTRFAGTCLYTAPEYFTNNTSEQNCDKVDVWSFGMLLWELLKKENYQTPFIFLKQGNDTFEPVQYETDMAFIFKVGSWYKKPPFEEIPEQVFTHTLDRDKQSRLDPSGKLFTLMQACLKRNPSDRPSMVEITEALSS